MGIYCYCSLRKNHYSFYKKRTKCSHVPETHYNKGQLQSGILNLRVGIGGYACLVKALFTESWFKAPSGQYWLWCLHCQALPQGDVSVISWPWSHWAFCLKNGHIGFMGGPPSYISATVIYAVPAIHRFSYELNLFSLVAKRSLCSWDPSLVILFGCVKAPIVS